MQRNDSAKKKGKSTSGFLANVTGYHHMSKVPIEPGETLKPWKLTDYNREAETCLEEVRMRVSPAMPSRIGGAFLCLPKNNRRRQGIPSFHDAHADLYNCLHTADIVDVNVQPTKLHVTDALVFSEFFCSYTADCVRGELSVKTIGLAERYWSNIPVGELEEAEVIVHPSSSVVITAQLEMPLSSV